MLWNREGIQPLSGCTPTICMFVLLWGNHQSPLTIVLLSPCRSAHPPHAALEPPRHPSPARPPPTYLRACLMPLTPLLSVENENHCDFVKLREMLIRVNMEDLREQTHSRHYELYRRCKLEEMGFQDSDGDSQPFR